MRLVQGKATTTDEAWEYQKVVQEEANRCAREADDEGTTSETWPPP
jgi:hypothetical protein